ncbi:MAG: methyltransferase domain-containing protein [Eubacterium sp.]|nr:methyltransferase domain-containing protein [Eubacterium sp.]
MEHSDKLTGIIKRLKPDSANPQLYQELGDYFSDCNPQQAFLCYQNALFYSDNEENKGICRQRMGAMERKGGAVSPCSFVILNYKFLEGIQACIQSIRQFCLEETYEIVVVDNASCDESTEWLRTQDDLVLVENTENRGFPGGCNDGIAAANPGNDIVLLNNDTIVMPNTLFCLRMALYEDERNGATGCITNYSSNGQQIYTDFKTMEDYLSFSYLANIPQPDKHERKTYLVGFAELIRRSVLDEIGGLDERFSPGNYENNDLGLRILQAGYRNILCHDSFIVHLGSQSFAKDPEAYRNLLQTNLQKINEKYGFSVSYYSYARNEVIELIDREKNDAFTVFEVGCGLGATLNRISYLYPNASVQGMELVESVALIGNGNRKIQCGDVEKDELDIPKHSVDVLIFADVIEHLRDPLKTLTGMKDYLKPDGCILMSIPNQMHYSVMIELLMGGYSWDEAGIRDYTHLHVFTLQTIRSMIATCGFREEELRGTYLGDKIPEDYAWFEDLIKREETAEREQFFVYQYLLRIRPDVCE